jgi:hypothetical protein
LLHTIEVQNETFEKIKSVLQKQSPPMIVSKNTKDYFELIGNKAVPYGSKKVMAPGMYFCSVFVRKDMISFHFFPIYMKREIFEPLIPNLIKLLKGKSCFNFKNTEQVNEKELSALLKKGVEAWEKLGYMN